MIFVIEFFSFRFLLETKMRATTERFRKKYNCKVFHQKALTFQQQHDRTRGFVTIFIILKLDNTI